MISYIFEYSHYLFKFIPRTVPGSNSFQDFFIRFERVIFFVDIFIYPFKTLVENDLIATLIKFDKDLINFREDKFIIICFDDEGELFFIEFGFKESE